MRETEILVEEQPPQGILVCCHAGLVINKLSLRMGGGEQRGGRSLEPVEVRGLFMKKPEALMDGAGSETGQGCDEVGTKRGSGLRPNRVVDMTDLCSDSEEPVVVSPAKRSRTVGKDEGMNGIQGSRNNNGGRAEVKEEMEEVVVDGDLGQGALAALAVHLPPWPRPWTHVSEALF